MKGKGMVDTPSNGTGEAVQLNSTVKNLTPNCRITLSANTSTEVVLNSAGTNIEIVL